MTPPELFERFTNHITIFAAHVIPSQFDRYTQDSQGHFIVIETQDYRVKLLKYELPNGFFFLPQVQQLNKKSPGVSFWDYYDALGRRLFERECQRLGKNSETQRGISLQQEEGMVVVLDAEGRIEFSSLILQIGLFKEALEQAGTNGILEKAAFERWLDQNPVE